MTPFERPVVPEVKKMDPRSEYFTSGRLTFFEFSSWTQSIIGFPKLANSSLPLEVSLLSPTKIKSSTDSNDSETFKTLGMNYGDITATFGEVVET